MRNTYGDIINVTRQEKEFTDSARQPEMRQTAVTTFIPRFDREGSVGAIINATSQRESNFFRVVSAPILKRRFPNSIFVEGPIPRPEKFDELAGQGKVITPAVLQKVGTY